MELVGFDFSGSYQGGMKIHFTGIEQRNSVCNFRIRLFMSLAAPPFLNRWNSQKQARENFRHPLRKRK
jgi:hypothetical protein